MLADASRCQQGLKTDGQTVRKVLPGQQTGVVMTVHAPVSQNIALGRHDVMTSVTLASRYAAPTHVTLLTHRTPEALTE